MKEIKRFGHASATACLLAVFPGMTALAAEPATLQPFESEAAFRKAIEVWTAESKKRGGSSDAGLVYDAPVPVAPAPSSPSVIGATAAAGASSDSLDRVEVTGSRIKASEDESITSVQTEGVDEGDIVNHRGDVLVVLRRGRLFTIRVGGDSLAPVSVANAYGDGVDPEGAWYDEMLVSGNTVVVIGYSYDRDGTEIGLFDLSDAGRITYRATYHLRSDDYYSSRNYASRLIGDKLIFYSPLHLWFDESMDEQMPGLRQWMPNKQENAQFNRILPATRIYRTPRDDALLIRHDYI